MAGRADGPGDGVGFDAGVDPAALISAGGDSAGLMAAGGNAAAPTEVEGVGAAGSVIGAGSAGGSEGVVSIVVAGMTGDGF